MKKSTLCTLFRSTLFITVFSFFASCSESFLSQEPAGDYIRQDQYDPLNNTLEGSVRGIYAKLYEFSGQDAFGERSIDMYGDILCGDMAVTTRLYGYFYCDENGESNTDRADYLWGYYYALLHNLNAIMAEVHTRYPHVEAFRSNPALTLSQEEQQVAGYYAQVLAMRGYVLMRLRHFFAPAPEVLSPSLPIVPLYDFANQDINQPRAKLSDLDAAIEDNLSAAIAYFDAFDHAAGRTSKLTVDGNIARTFLAYAYLNKAKPADTELYQQTLSLAEEVIASGEYSILPKARLFSGFNDISEASWMWGQEVTSETATLLGSFFGQVDIHTYSYAWAGETKACDRNLYNAIPAWDARKQWFNDGKKNPIYALCPDKKFYSAKCPESTRGEDIDRSYLSDNVFLRIEAVYLMAAEAACRLGDYEKAKRYLTAITDERVADEAAYAEWKTGLGADNLLKEIGYNWRIELWGEGFGLQTFRRLTKEIRRGANHLCRPGAVEQSNDDGTFKIQIPSNEYVYNPLL